MVVIVLIVFVVFAPPESRAAGTTSGPELIIVKFKASLAQETETELLSISRAKEMKISSTEIRNPRLQAFVRRYSARQLSALYPDIIRAKRQHGWSDAQFSQHIRDRFAARGRRGTRSSAVPELSRTYVLALSPISSDQQRRLLQRLKSDPDVEFAEPVHKFSIKQLTNDPFLNSSGSWGQPYGDLWGLTAIGAPAAWDLAMGDGTVVAVVDTGLDYNHPDLAANVWTNANEIESNGFDDDANGFADDFRGWNFQFGNNDPIDWNGHGTHVAGTVAASGNNGIGVVGVAPHSRVLAIKGLDDNGYGYDFTLAPAITYAVINGADVINASWGSTEKSQSIEEAIQFATGLGTIFVASAGNSSEDATNFFPASSPEAITVAAFGPFSDFAWFSNFGAKIDITAPGMEILSTQAFGSYLGYPVSDGYMLLDGTSMAAPHVAGVAALLLSQHPDYSTEQVRQAIRASATSVADDARFGSGLLNAAAATVLSDPLEAKITGLQFGASPIDPIIITGFAQGSGFVSYTLEYGEGAEPYFWTPFFTSYTPASATLGVLDPSNLFDGTFTIRLTAFNSTGTAFFDKTQFTLTLTRISSPLRGNTPTAVTTFKPGVVLPITGTATMPSFQNYVVEWASGLNAFTGWQNTGITLTNDGLAPVGDGQLATWDTSAVTRAGYYSIRLTVNGTSGSQQTSTAVYLEPDLYSINWPVFIDQGPYFDSGVLPALNADSSLRLVMQSPNIGTTPAASWVFNVDGSFQKSPMDLYGSYHQPAIGNIDWAPGDEAVMPDFNAIRVIHPDNSFEIFRPSFEVDLTKNPLLLEDLNNDFALEAVALGNSYYNNSAYVFAWQPDGKQVPGFPIQVQDQNPLKNWYNHSRVLVGDFDGDGAKDILVVEGLTSTTYTVRLFGTDGSPKDWNAPVLSGMSFAMVAADLDHNGKLETLLVSLDGPVAMLHVLQPDGSERPGWPINVSTSSQYAQAFLAIGDLDRDGREEIVLSHETELYVFRSDGNLFSSAWPLRTGILGYGAVVIGDVDGDGQQEIVTTLTDASGGYYDAKLLAIRSNGSIALLWQLTGSHGLDQYAYPAPAIGDFDQDGKTEIAVAYEVTGAPAAIPGVVTLLSTQAPYDSNNDWPTMLQNVRDTSVLLRSSPSMVMVSVPAGSNPSTLGASVSLAARVTPAGATGSVQFFDGSAPLSGPLQLHDGAVCFETSALSIGEHSITARYTGNNKLNASVSPVFNQVVVKGNSTVAVVLSAGSNPSRVVDELTFTATVAPDSATGTVVFFDNGDPISAEIPLADGAATLTISSFPAGIHSITARYSGNSILNEALSPPWLQTIENSKTDSSVAVSLSAGSNPSIYGATLAFVASVVPQSAGGSVVFFDGTEAISGSLPVSGGAATFSTMTLAAGVHSITARYSGDGNVDASVSAALFQTVVKAPTHVKLELAVGSDSVAYGRPITFKATMDPTIATGTVVFFDGFTPISDPIPLISGSANFTTSSLEQGTHSISGRYSGDANFNSSNSTAHKVKVK